MAIGNPITLTSNVASKTINVIATASQSSFTVNGGYRINEIAVFRNGVRLVNGRDFTARDGTTVTLLSAASEGDAVEFQVFDTFRVADAITPFDSDQTIAGNLNITGILSASQLGSVNFNLTSGIQTFHDVRVGGALTVAGALTFDDVTNVDSVGYATFRSGINVQGAGSTTTTLNVTGVATVGNNISIGDSIFHTGDGGGTTFGFPAADTFTVYTNGSERIRVSAAGSFGIGTNDPTESLHIDGNLRMGSTGDSGNFTDSRSTTTRALTIGAGGDALLVTHSSGQGLGFFGYEAGGDRLVIACDAGSGGNKIDFITDAGTSNDADNLNGKVPKMRITSDGKVCIGSAADEDLEFGTDVTTILQLTHASAPKLILCRDDTSVVTDDYLGIIDFHSRDGGIKRVARIGARAGGNHGSDDGPANLVFHTMGDNTATSAEERLRITYGGQVNVAGNFTQTTYTMQVTGTFNATSNITQNGNALATNGKAIAMALIFG